MAHVWLPAPFGLCAQLFVSLSLAILFLQSGIDKVLDYSGNLEWLRGHFAKTPVARYIGPLLAVLAAMETFSGLTCLFGFLHMLAGGPALIAAYGVCCCMGTFVALFAGQRIAKDYAGAAALIPYMTFCVVALAVCVMNLPNQAIKEE
jgi:hypothetical protein